MTDCVFNIDPSYHKEKGDKNTGLKNSFHCTIVDFYFSNEKGFLSAEMNWVLTIKKGNKHLLKCSVTYAIMYSDVIDLGDGRVEVYEAFINRVGKFATYPYFRSITSHLGNEARAGIPIMPILK